PNSDFGWGAHAPRVPFSAPSRKTSARQTTPNTSWLRPRATCWTRGESSSTRGRVCSPTSVFGLKRWAILFCPVELMCPSRCVYGMILLPRLRAAILACEAFAVAALLTLSLGAVAGEPSTLSLHRSRTALELTWHGVTLSADGSVQRPYFELQRSAD